MKRTLNLIALAAICCAMMVSCKNTKNVEPTPEEIEAQKVALADSVLAKIDEYADQFIKRGDDGCLLANVKLTDEEKLVKPDYLLDPNEASSFITKTQKVNALAIYNMEYFVRLLYDMPIDDVKAVIAKLAIEVNHPIDSDIMTSDKPVSEVISEQYNVCKERGDIAYFWQFQMAVLREFDYLLAKNPELYLRKISEDNRIALNAQWVSCLNALWTLAPYDEEINMITQTLVSKSKEELTNNQNNFASVETTIETFKSNRYKFIELRNALLQ